jgi:Uma2 family endonuclease
MPRYNRAVAATLAGVEEYLSTSYHDGDREYVHADLQTRIAIYLAARYPGFWTAVEVRVQVRADRFRVPDVIVVAGPRPRGRIIVSPPHLAIEVLSPEDRAGDMQERIDDYLAFGIPYVWVINPRTQRAYIHTVEVAHEAKDRILRAVNPAIDLPLDELFAI